MGIGVSERAKATVKAPAAKMEKTAARMRQPESVSSSSSPYEQVIQLQRTFGNQAMQRLFKAGIIQAKLRINQLKDVYEQEADRAADRVMSMPESARGKSPSVTRVQASNISCSRYTNNGEALQRQMQQPFSIEEGLIKEGPLQAKAIPNRSTEMRTGLASRVESLRTGGRNLSPSTRAFMESRFDRDFSDVRIHVDSQAAETAKSLNARAFTMGRDIVFGDGQFTPASKSGMQLLAHELTHVIQQGKAPQALQKTTAIPSYHHQPPKDQAARESTSASYGGKGCPPVLADSRDTNIIRRVRWNPNTDTGTDSYPWRTGPHGDVLTAATDGGTPIEIWRPHDGTTYWCHGFTFGGSTARGGPYSLWGRAVPAVLQDDGWRPVDSCVARNSDIMIFYDQAGRELHSGIIRHVSAPDGSVDEAASTLESKWGMLPLGVSSWLTNAASYGRYRCFSKAPAYGPCLTGGINELSGDRPDCPRYEPGEVSASRTSRGLLDPDVTMLGPGQLLIADFGIGWQGVKGSTRMEPLMRSWLRTFESDSSYRLRIFGYGDCSGTDRANERIRRGRAEQVERILGPGARSRVVMRDMAVLGVYITGNNMMQGRARNRGVVIEFYREP
jgi:hypothetical protein